MTTVVIMPGGFHPYHAGHHALYQSAQRTFPDAEVYVAATNDTSSRPFPFAVKEKLARLAGVDAGHFVQVKSPFRAEEITSKFDPNKDTLIFVRSEKDANTPPQAGGVKKDGSPSYLQPLLGARKLEPFAKHAYMAYLPTVEFGPGMTSATQIRSAWPGLDERRKTALVMSLYPRTQTSPQLAQTVVKLLDAAIGGEQGVTEGLENYNGIQLSLGVEKDDEFVDDDDTDNQTIHVQATADGRELGQVIFAIDYDAKGMILVPQDLEVDERFRGQGIAATMYDYVKSKGYRIRRSDDQTPAGSGFWDKHKPGQNVWEQGVAEGAPIVVALAPIDVRNPKKAPQPYRNQGDIVPDTKPPSTEKRGVKGRPGQRPMPDYTKDLDENQGWAATFTNEDDYIEEKWSSKYKSSINCAAPRGFSQRAHCAGRKK
jgi:GNAT superfamily N-acetyltransferase